VQPSRLLKQYSKSRPCYYCGAPPPSKREHAPSKALFQAFDCNAITVPSCDRHNAEKNLDDRAIQTVLLFGLLYGLKRGSLSRNALKALDFAASKLGDAKEVALQSIVDDPTGELNTPIATIDNTEIVETWLRQLTAALTWSVVGQHDPDTKWDNAKVWSPHYSRDADRKGRSVADVAIHFREQNAKWVEYEKEAVYWWAGWSAHPTPYPPDIYHFELSFFPSQHLTPQAESRRVAFRHRFHGQFTWYVDFQPSSYTRDAILTAVRTLKAANDLDDGDYFRCT
jgi:hypothetical protein